MEELENAGNAFRAALDQYLSVCSKIDRLLLRPGVLRNIPQQHLDTIHSEMKYSHSHKSKLREAEVAVARIHNHLPGVVPIASLPPEILAHIFQLVAKPCLMAPHHGDSDSESNSDSDSNSDTSISASENSEQHHEKACDWWLEEFPAGLDNLTHVCSHWRKTAIACPSLWTHIDLLSHSSLYNRFLARAETYVSRAAQLPLELHLADAKLYGYNKASLGRFLSLVFSRVESVHIAVIHDWGSFYEFLLNDLFFSRISQPNIFAKLTTSFTRVKHEPDEFFCWPSKANSFRFKTLHLHGFFPLWDTRVYHNLVDLRLITSHDEYCTSIPESQLRSILAASPGLQIFHFALQITDRQRDDKSIIPVHLNDLEALSITTDRGEHGTIMKLGHVLRLIAPGSKPLRLSIWHDFLVYDPTDNNIYEDEFSPEELARFFERSNLKQFCFNNEEVQPDRLLRHAASLEDLTLKSYILPPHPNDPALRINPITSRLNSLTLQNCLVSLDRLEVLLQQYPTNLLVLSECCWSCFESPPESWDPVRGVSELLERYPGTKAIFETSNASMDWDLID